MSEATCDRSSEPVRVVVRPDPGRSSYWRAAVREGVDEAMSSPCQGGVAYLDLPKLRLVCATLQAQTPLLLLADVPVACDAGDISALHDAIDAAPAAQAIVSVPEGADLCYTKLSHPRIALVPRSLGIDTLATLITDRAQRMNVVGEQAHGKPDPTIHTDALTGALDRRGFIARLGRAILSNTSGQPSAAVVFLDVDDFKSINDTLGHETGDRVLQVVADRLRHCLRDIDGQAREPDAIARLGGDEFCVFIDGVASSHEAFSVAARIADAFVDPVGVGSHTLPIGISMGVTLVDPEHTTPEAVLRDADTAMYEAKRAGKARFRVYDERLRVAARRQARLENDLRGAISRDEFAIVYQPIVRSEDGNPVAFEALLRWKHPTKGVMLPARFLEVADDSGVLADLTEWIVSHAIQQMSIWRDRYSWGDSVELCVNLSRRQLIHPGLHDTLFAAMDRHKFDPSHLCLEFKEEALTHRSAASPSLLSSIHDRGVKLAIDDFGAGAASLAALGAIPLDAIKIDQHCIDLVDGRNSDRIALVDAILTMARRLSINAIAEGVAHSDQLATLLAMGCTRLQGNLIAEPLDARGIENFIESRAHNAQPDAA
ncbi:MAG: bifunctional diguanylate cyclase/phosphodiesterase [Planctomycetota bacterium]